MKTSNYGERLYAVMEAKKVDRKSLAAAIGKTVQAVGQVINGKSKALAAESHQKAVDFLGCSGAWLAEGKGEMFLPDAAQPAGHIKTDVQELTQIERQASGFSPRFERSGRNGLLLLNVLPQYFNRGTAA